MYVRMQVCVYIHAYVYIHTHMCMCAYLEKQCSEFYTKSLSICCEMILGLSHYKFLINQPDYTLPLCV